MTMDLDNERIDEAVLALLYLTLHDGNRAWKGLEWDALDRLRAKGLLAPPRRGAKSVEFTEAGLERGRAACEGLFGSGAGEVAKAPAGPARRGKTESPVYQIKVTLLGVKPAVWRRLLVPSRLTLARLHEVLQIAMGWTDSHLHAFRVGDVTYSAPDLDGDLDFEPEQKARVGQVLPGEKAKLLYEYDFGDGWEHEVVVEKVLPPDAALAPRCLEGRRACPPDDCGGVGGYQHLLRVLANPQHEDHEEMQEWVGEAFDPTWFDLEDVNEVLGHLRW